MDTTELLNTKIGTIDKPKLQAKPVKIASVIFQTHNKDGKEMTTPLAQVLCKHPDKDDVLKITKIKFIDGEDITKLTGKKQQAVFAKCGYVFQFAALLDSLNVFENI